MSEETKQAPQEDVTQEVTQEEAQQPMDPGKLFDFADVHFKCSHCGNDQVVAEALRGISFTVPAAEKAEVLLKCEKCGTSLKLYFTESSEEAKAMRKAEIAEQEKAMQNGNDQENTEVEAGSGDTNDAERVAEPNEAGDGNPETADAPGQAVDA